jgi:hypothetical protein
MIPVWCLKAIKKTRQNPQSDTSLMGKAAKTERFWSLNIDIWDLPALLNRNFDISHIGFECRLNWLMQIAELYFI